MHTLHYVTYRWTCSYCDTVLQINFLFLLNIMRDLVKKLRQSHASELLQAWYVVVAGYLGMTDILS